MSDETLSKASIYLLLSVMMIAGASNTLGTFINNFSN